MTLSRSPYMEWAKSRPRPDVDLAGSNLLPCRLEELPGAREAVDISGESPEGYPPLVESIARAHAVEPERVATANGCSGANFLAFAALLQDGDHALVETPYYDPLPAAARMLGGRVSHFPRRFEDGYDLDPALVAEALTPRTRLLVLTNPHNPSGALLSEDRLREVVRMAERHGFSILVDEVYRDAVVDDRPTGPFVERVLRETGTAVAPGHFFGAPDHFRIAFGGEPEKVAAGLDAITRCLTGGTRG